MTWTTVGTLVLGGDLTVGRLGYGAPRLTGPGGWGELADRERAKSVLRRAVELGASFIDTADAYGPAVNERLIAEALHPYPEGLVIATKGGHLRPGPWRLPADLQPRATAPRVRGELAPPMAGADRPVPTPHRRSERAVPRLSFPEAK